MSDPSRHSDAPCSLLTQTGSCTLDVPDGTYLLAAVGFARQPVQRVANLPVFDVGLPLLAGDVAHELWLSPRPVRYGQSDAITYSENGDVLFGHVLLDEVGEGDEASLQALSQQAYQQIFALLAQSGYGCLLRIWNYFPAITALNAHSDSASDALNRYQAFCLGRQAALDDHDNFAYSPPAATAIGTHDGGLQIYFIAAKQAGVQLENPRQTSAFLYPRQYGPVSPAFSRATVKAWDAQQNGYQHVYVSGTASIVGYETLHVGDVQAQLQETLRNLEALLEHGDETLGLPINRLAQLSQLKVYVHDKQQLPLIREQLDAYFDTYFAANATEPYQKPVIVYLQGDVCRADLLVEMEAIYA